MFSDLAIEVDILTIPCDTCSVGLQKIIAYVRGAVNQTALVGPNPWSNFAMHACECPSKNGTKRVLVRPVGPAHDACNASYPDACPTL
jgi:hypothetical protein